MTVAEMKVADVLQKLSVFHSILVATDFSEASRSALAEGVALAGRYNSKLSIVHVIPPDWRYEMLPNPPEIDLERIGAERKLQAQVRDLHPDREADSILIKHGPVSKAVLAAIAESDADLLLIGTHGRGGLSKLALGSVAEELLRTVPCPVMTIGPKAAAFVTDRPELKAILFAVDFGAGSTKALPLVLQLARTHRARLILLNVIPPAPTPSSSLSAYAPASLAADELQGWEANSSKHAIQKLRKWIGAKGQLEQEPEYVVGRDFLTEGILAAASKFEAGLIVMGSNWSPLAKLAAHLPWTAVHEVIHDASCPVLTVAG
jgi:nucleotide-binding universal stress UspA family protein